MGKIDQFSNGESGASVRNKVNEALKDVAFTEFESGVVIDDDSMATATATNLSTSEAIKAYIDNSIGSIIFSKSYSFKSRSGTSGITWLAGYYDSSGTDANLTQAGTTVTYGTANIAYAAHAFVVCGGAGGASGGTTGVGVLTVTGTSITDAGVRTPGDSQVVVADNTAVALDEYYETPKKWIGQITFTLSQSGDRTAYNLDFNYGFSKYEDLLNRDFQLNGLEMVGVANANDSGFNIEVLKHDNLGWTYAATGFLSGGTVIASMNTDHTTEIDISSGEGFAYKRTNLNELVAGTASEGIIVRLTTSTNNSIANMDVHLSGLLTSTLIT